jgi:hypothetical protein
MVRRITIQERLDFFIELDRELRDHPTHIHVESDDSIPWSFEAIKEVILLHPYKKREFMRYTREKGKVGSLGPRL